MRRSFFILLVVIDLLLGSFSFADAQSQPKQFTGGDWLRLTQKERIETVASFIQSAKVKGIIIKKTSAFYRLQLDAFYDQHPDLKKESVAVVLKTIMIMEYDWEVKGIDKDTLARKWLGEELYKRNKARLRQ